jgi:hypothetical protein
MPQHHTKHLHDLLVDDPVDDVLGQVVNVLEYCVLHVSLAPPLVVLEPDVLIHPLVRLSNHPLRFLIMCEIYPSPSHVQDVAKSGDDFGFDLWDGFGEFGFVLGDDRVAVLSEGAVLVADLIHGGVDCMVEVELLLVHLLKHNFALVGIEVGQEGGREDSFD